MQKKPYTVKILLHAQISNACKALNSNRKTRYNERQNIATKKGLNFRCDGKLVHRKSAHISSRRGTCMVCQKRASECTCLIEVRDQTGNVTYMKIEAEK